MYSRDFGGLRSDGQLKEFQDRLQKQYEGGEPVREEPFREKEEETGEKKASRGLLDLFKFDLDLGFLKNIKIEDLILIGIGLLILLGKEEHNTLIIILIALLVIL